MDGFAFQVEVLRTDRKKSASIDLDGDLVRVSVPKTLSEGRIRDLISKRSSWITAKLNEYSRRPCVKPKEYVSGETFPYLGRNYRLKVTAGDCASIKLKGGYFEVTTLSNDKDSIATTKALLEAWYMAQAERRLRDKTDRWSKIIGVLPQSVSIRSYKSRWGSCSAKGDMSYNWRIILAPHRIVDYVIVHELCHLKEHNHSSRYWKHVGRYIPDWKDCRDWLKEEGITLSV